MTNNKKDYQTSIRAYRSTVDRISEYSERVFGTDSVPYDAVLCHLLDAQE